MPSFPPAPRASRLPALAGALACAGALLLPAARAQTAPFVPVAPGKVVTEFSIDAYGFGEGEVDGLPGSELDVQAWGFEALVRWSPAELWNTAVGFRTATAKFDVPAGLPVPDQLVNTALIFSGSRQFGDQWFAQLTITPGYYGDGRTVTNEYFNVPALLLAAYTYRPGLVFVGGLAIDVFSNIPVLPVLGARWRFADDWTLSLIYPRPGVEYRVTDGLTVSAGARLQTISGRVADDFGQRYGRPELDGELFTADGIAATAAVRWRAVRWLTLDAEAGFSLSRNLEFQDVDLDYDVDNAPFVRLGATVTF